MHSFHFYDHICDPLSFEKLNQVLVILDSTSLSSDACSPQPWSDYILYILTLTHLQTDEIGGLDAWQIPASIISDFALT